MNRNKMTIYTAGAMEAAGPDLGAGWRKELTPFLESLGFEVLNPTDFEPMQLKDLRPSRLPEFYTDLHGNKIKPTHWHELKNSKEPNLYARFKKYMERIIRYDIDIVRNHTDIVVAFVDPNCLKGAGTHSEITEAFLVGVPVYIVATTDIPAWMKGCATEIFLTFDDLKKFLANEYGKE